ncbi:glycosyl transferase family 1, partial [Haloferax sp. Atlit-6N]|uniref:glycosyltransferase family 4 protein n=1 Tax=Haloferax sp. Atlit-6N TaxID=2077205 RepID=UPI000E3A3354
DADVLHLNLMGPRSVWYARRARKAGVPVVAHTHVTAEDFGDSFRFTNALARPLRPYLRRAYGLADRLICPSEYNRSVIEGYTDAPTTVVSNGVDRGKLDGFESLEAEYRDRYDLGGTVVFLVGNVFERKGLTTFCRVAESTPYDFPWFGPYDTGPHASKAVRQWTTNPPENVTFTG